MTEHRVFPLAGARAHYGPDKCVEVVHIDLHLRPDFATKTLFGVCTQTVQAIEDGVVRVTLDAVDLCIDAVTVDDIPQRFIATSQTLCVDFGRSLSAGERICFAITYRAIAPRRGLYFIDGRTQVWTQSQDQDARFWFPCFDYPADKQTTSTTIVVSRGLFALANGAEIARTDDGDVTVFRYEQAVRHATYLVTMVAGEFAEIRQMHSRLPVWYYVERGREADGERAFGNTPRMIDCFESIIGVPYPYARYGQIAVSDFLFGGMENTAATTQTDRTLHDVRAQLDFSSDPLVSHELAHQWFGDLVTCRDWSQAWLNEGFATYFEAVWREADLGWDEYAYDIFMLVTDYLQEDRERYRRPIVCNVFRDPIELFDAHLYQKGGAVLHMLRGELGWARLRRVLQRYVHDNMGRSVETIDLVRAIEATTGRNLRAFFEQWIERGGHPELRVDVRWDAERGVAFVSVDQVQTVDADHPAYAFALDLGLLTALPSSLEVNAGDDPLPSETRLRVRVERQHERFAVALDSAPKLVRVDPGAYVLGVMTYAFDADHCAAILQADPSPVSRVRAARALGKDGSRFAHEALATSLAHDPFWGVASEVASVLGESRCAAGCAALLANIGHPHPKVRRAVAAALGNFQANVQAADALLTLIDDDSYFVCAAAYESLGRTRDERALATLTTGVKRHSWNQTVEAGAARGLGELADERALGPLLSALDPGCGEGLRRDAIRAIARLGVLVDAVRTRAVDALERAFDDRSYLVRVSAYAACEALADARSLASLDRLSLAENDGRLRRDAAEAALRIRAAQRVPSEVSSLREELEALRSEARALRERVDGMQPAR